MADAFDLVHKWLVYARKNGIRTKESGGRPAEDTDLSSFLGQEGFDADVYQPLVDELPETEPAQDEVSDEPEQERGPLPDGAMAEGPDGKNYFYMSGEWRNPQSFSGADEELSKQLTDTYWSSPETQVPPTEPEEAEPEPEQYEPESIPDIPAGTKKKGSDGDWYTWARKYWLNADTLKHATKEINAELNAEYEESGEVPSPETEPDIAADQEQYEPESIPDIAPGVKQRGPDGKTYTWGRKYWLDTETLRRAPEAINNELNIKYEEDKEADSESFPGPEVEEPFDAGPVPDGEGTEGAAPVDQDEVGASAAPEDETQAQAPGTDQTDADQTDTTGPAGEAEIDSATSDVSPARRDYSESDIQQINKIKKVVRKLNKKQQQQLWRDLHD